MAQNPQTRQLQAISDTYTYSTSDFVPTKTLTVRKIHGYNHLRKLAKPNFGIFCSSSSVELAYRKSGTSAHDGFYTKRLLSVACVILDQENLRNSTQSCIIENFPYLLEAKKIQKRGLAHFCKSL